MIVVILSLSITLSVFLLMNGYAEETITIRTKYTNTYYFVVHRIINKPLLTIEIDVHTFHNAKNAQSKRDTH